MIDIQSTLTIVLFSITILMLSAIIFLLLKNKLNRNDIDSMVTKSFTTAFSSSSFMETIGSITASAKDIKADYRKLDEMLRVPKERADLGEIALEQILSDQLHHEMFGIRKRILDGKVPDAHINSTVGIICIDSKFPLDNYRRMCEVENRDEKEYFKKSFIKDVKGHLAKIANDYVTPDKGTASFAFAYIHSETVYYFLVTEAYELLKEFTKKGVQVVSPLTLSHKIELIKAGVHAKLLSEKAELVNNQLIILARSFKDLSEKWNTFFTHFTNADRCAVGDLDRVYKKLQHEFEEISRGIN